ncbi:MAG: DUF1559 domain-containing protein [Planctomycetota bacterium]|jgi:type II secretory pathway pseudopilin PulG
MIEVERIPGPEWSNSMLEQNRFVIDIALHIILLVIAVSPFVLLYWKRQSPVGWLDFWLLLMAVLAVPFASSYVASALPKYFAPFVVGYAALCLVVLVISLFLFARRMKQQSKGSYAMHVLASLALMGILIGLFLPAVPSAREAAKRMLCSNRIRQIGLAIIETRSRANDLSQSPPNNKPAETGGPPVSWRIKILPWLEEGAIANEYQVSSPWDSAENWKLAQRIVPAYTCPSEPNLVSRKGGRFTAYAMLENSNRDPENPNLLPTGRIISADGDRILLIESCGANLIWTEPRDVDVDTLDWAVLPFRSGAKREPWRSRGVGASFHGSGTHAVFDDGSTRFLPAATDKEVLRQMLLGKDWDRTYLE